MAAATISLPRFTFEPLTLGVKTFSRPETTFFNDYVHTLEPSQHCWVIIWIIESLGFAIE